MIINTGKIQGDSYLVNGTISVPKADGGITMTDEEYLAGLGLVVV